MAILSAVWIVTASTAARRRTEMNQFHTLQAYSLWCKDGSQSVATALFVWHHGARRFSENNFRAILDNTFLLPGLRQHCNTTRAEFRDPAILMEKFAVLGALFFLYAFKFAGLSEMKRSRRLSGAWRVVPPALEAWHLTHVNRFPCHQERRHHPMSFNGVRTTSLRCSP